HDLEAASRPGGGREPVCRDRAGVGNVPRDGHVGERQDAGRDDAATLRVGEGGTGTGVGRIVHDGGADQGQGGGSPVEDAAASGGDLAADDIQGGDRGRRVARHHS